jgi:hypothetical protein
MRRRKNTSEKKKKLMTTLFTAFIALIMITSIIGFLYTDTQQKIKIENYSFYRNGDNWVLDDFGITFRYLPEQLNGYNVSIEAVNILKNSNMVLLTLDTTNKSITDVMDIADIGYSLGEILTEQLSIYTPPPAILSEDERFPNATIITCANTSIYIPVLSIQMGSEPGIIFSDGCIHMKGKSSSQLAALKEALLYRIIGIWQE